MPDGKTAIAPSTTVAAVLRGRRRELGLTLRDVAARTEASGQGIPYPTLARIERGQVDPGLRRLHALLRIYDLPFELAGDLLELESLAGRRPPRADLQQLIDHGKEAWQRGDFRDALAHVIAVRIYATNRPEDRRLRQTAILAFSSMAARLGRLRLSLRLIDELLLEPVEAALLPNALIQAAVTWHELGCLPVAFGLLDQAKRLVEESDAQRQAWIANLEAVLLTKAGRLEEALAASRRSRDSYDRVGDSHGTVKALLRTARILAQSAAWVEAERALDEANGLAERQGHAELVTAVQMQRGELLLASGAGEDAIPLLESALKRAQTAGDLSLQFVGHYSLWKAYTALGDRDRARFECEAARYHVRFVEDVTPEAEEVRRLVAGGGTHDTRKRKRRRSRS